MVKKSEQLFNKQWLIGKQHLLLDDLILGRYTVNLDKQQHNTSGTMRQTSTTNLYCTRYCSLESRVQFVESYKLLGHNDYYVSEFLKALREKPRYLASLIVRAERVNTFAEAFTASHLVAIVFQSLYGNCVLVQDEFYCLQLLNNLIELQFNPEPVDTNNQPSTAPIDLRRLIRKQSCSFNVLFKLYTSFSHSMQLFLTAALYDPITQILTDEWFLDIDPDKALARFTPEEITNK